MKRVAFCAFCACAKTVFFICLRVFYMLFMLVKSFLKRCKTSSIPSFTILLMSQTEGIKEILILSNKRPRRLYSFLDYSVGFYCRVHKKEIGNYLENQSEVFRENFFSQKKKFFQTKKCFLHLVSNRCTKERNYIVYFLHTAK